MVLDLNLSNKTRIEMIVDEREMNCKHDFIN